MGVVFNDVRVSIKKGSDTSYFDTAPELGRNDKGDGDDKGRRAFGTGKKLHSATVTESFGKFAIELEEKTPEPEVGGAELSKFHLQPLLDVDVADIQDKNDTPSEGYRYSTLAGTASVVTTVGSITKLTITVNTRTKLTHVQKKDLSRSGGTD